VKRRSFWIFTLPAILLLVSCSSRSPAPANNNSSTDRIVSSVPPFKTREPQRYKALRTITSTGPAGESRVTKTEIARDQSLRREEEIGEDVVLLESDQGRFLLLPQEKIYADIGSESFSSDETAELDNSPERLLHSDTLTSTYEKFGSELVGTRNTTKYKVSVNTSSGGNVRTVETTIWVDEVLGMPVKSETKAPDGSATITELSNIELTVDQALFQLPVEFQKVTAAELRRRRVKN
jgi:hypothetical protein